MRFTLSLVGSPALDDDTYVVDTLISGHESTGKPTAPWRDFLSQNGVLDCFVNLPERGTTCL